MASPLSVIREVVKTRSVACLPRKMIVATWISSVSWLSTGILRQDSIIILPNAVNVCLGLFQLSLFIIFPNKSIVVQPVPANIKPLDMQDVDLDRVGLLTVQGGDCLEDIDLNVHSISKV